MAGFGDFSGNNGNKYAYSSNDNTAQDNNGQLPEEFEHAIRNVTMAHLENVDGLRGIVASVLGTLPSSWRRADPQRPMGARDLLELTHFPDFGLMATTRTQRIQGANIARRAGENQEQAYLRTILREIVPRNAFWAQRYVDGLGIPRRSSYPSPPPPPTPAPAPVPPPPTQRLQRQPSRLLVPALPQATTRPARSVVKAKTTTKRASSTTEGERYFCPGCPCSHPIAGLRDMTRHWFEEHARSNRSAAELKRKWKEGQLDEWDEDEEKKRKEEEPAAAKEKRKAAKKAAGGWKVLRETSPERFEREAQVADGYPGYAPGFVTLKHKSLAEKREKREKGKGKDEKKKGGDEDEEEEEDEEE